jgi:hypothetical protein
MTLGKVTVSVTGAVTATFLCRVLSGTRQRVLPSARQKALGKEGFADALFAEPSLLSVTLGKGFAECFRHSTKLLIPVVNGLYTQVQRRARATTYKHTRQLTSTVPDPSGGSTVVHLCAYESLLIIGSKFYTIRFKARIRLRSNSISIYFLTKIYLVPYQFMKKYLDHDSLPPLPLASSIDLPRRVIHYRTQLLCRLF